MNNYLLKDITEKIGSGATPNGGQNSYHSAGISLIRSQNVHDFNFSRNGLAFIDEDQARELNNVKVNEKDILLNITGDSIARVCKVPINVLPARVNQHVAIIRANKDVDSDYLLSYLVNMKPYLLKICGVGGTRNALTKVAIEKLIIKLPDFRTQKNIGLLIKNVNSKIELNNRINAELEAMAKTLYDYWFVQFDFPDKNGKPYKTSGGKMVWNEELKREIPEGWEVKKVASLTDLISRGISPIYIENGGVCVLNQKCIRENSVLFEFSRRHDHQLKNATSKKVNLYDLLVNSTGVGTLGRVAIVKRLPENFVTVDSHVTILRSDINKVNPLYFGFSLIQKQKEIEGFSVGSTGQVELSKSQLEGIHLTMPPESIQNSFGETYKCILGRMSICEIENQKLIELRDWLLPMLMNGQVKVKNETETELSMAAETQENYITTKK